MAFSSFIGQSYVSFTRGCYVESAKDCVVCECCELSLPDSTLQHFSNNRPETCNNWHDCLLKIQVRGNFSPSQLIPLSLFPLPPLPPLPLLSSTLLSSTPLTDPTSVLSIVDILYCMFCSKTTTISSCSQYSI